MLVHPHFIFALPVQGRSYLTFLRKLKHLQNKAKKEKNKQLEISILSRQSHHNFIK